tara:strand:- start:3081 stop:5852 length:2772 start_codon:yes stop_codon:yes gene_type:complete
MRLLRYVLPYIPHFIISIIGFAVYSGSQVAATEWLKRVIDFVNNPQGDLRLILPLLLIAIALIRGVGFFIGNYLLSSISNRLVHNIRMDLFNSLTSLPSSFYDNHSSGHLISRITFNVMQVTGAATNAIKILIREGLLVIGLIAYLMYLNWKLAMFLFIAAPFIALIVSIASRRLRKISTRIQTAMGNVTHVASETINGYQEVKTFGGEEYEKKRFQKASDNNRQQNLKLEATNSISSPLIQLFVSLALALITWLALDASVLTNMTPGTFIAFFTAAGMLAKPVRQLSEINSYIQKGIAAAADIFSQIDADPEKNEGVLKKDSVVGDIAFNNISFSYDTEESLVKVLKNISLEIQSGKTVAFVGKSGAGKTTLLSLIPRFYDSYEGSISLDGTEIKDFELGNLRSHIAIVSQNITLFNDTVANNISYGLSKITMDEIEEAACRANADEFIKLLPDGYNTLVGDDGALLSGGQRQRIAIARAILKDAPILILDEATSALDSESENVIQEAIFELSKNRTTLIIAHRLSTIENADTIVVLDKGKIVEQGTHKELLGNKDVYAELHKNQFKDNIEEHKILEKPLSIQHEIPETPYSEVGLLENSWYKKSTWLYLLWPLSLITLFFSRRKRNKFLTGKIKGWKSALPTIIVGNIVAGGTGKTPIVMWLANYLTGLGYKPGIVSRGYGGKVKKPLLIDTKTKVTEAGDESLIIYKNTGCPVVISPNRVEAAKVIEKETDCNLIISDDGLQHYSLLRDIEIIVFDGTRGVGNSLMLPAGPLREDISRALEADIVISSSKSLNNNQVREDFIMKYNPVEWSRIHDNKSFPVENWPLSKNVNAVAGIGNPNKFFNQLRVLGLNVIEHAFPDHYQFSEQDLIFNNSYPVIMTQKDAVRCKGFNQKNLWFLKIQAEIDESFGNRIAKLIKDCE